MSTGKEMLEDLNRRIAEREGGGMRVTMLPAAKAKQNAGNQGGFMHETTLVIHGIRLTSDQMAMVRSCLSQGQGVLKVTTVESGLMIRANDSRWLPWQINADNVVARMTGLLESIGAIDAPPQQTSDNRTAYRARRPLMMPDTTKGKVDFGYPPKRPEPGPRG